MVNHPFAAWTKDREHFQQHPLRAAIMDKASTCHECGAPSVCHVVSWGFCKKHRHIADEWLRKRRATR